MEEAFSQIKSQGGIELESSYKYTAEDGRCAWKKSKATNVTVTGYTKVKKSESALQSAVTAGPLSIGVAANDAWQNQNSGVLS